MKIDIKKNHPLSIRPLFAVLLTLGCLCLSTSQAKAFPLTDSDPNSPQFRKQFVGSYGVNAAIEPRLTQRDRPLYEAIAPHLERKPSYAIKKVEKNLTPESNAAFDFLLGNLYYSIQNFEQAEYHLQNAIKKFPTFRRAYRTLALTQVQKNRFEASIPYWLKVITLGGGDAQSYGLLAYAYLIQEKYRSALTAYQMARMYAPDSLDYKRGEAQCLLKTEQYKEAIALFDELIAESPEIAEFWRLQANAFLAQEKHESAMINLEIAHELDTPRWESIVLLGDLYLNQKTNNLAFETYKRGLKIDIKKSTEDRLTPLKRFIQLRLYDWANAYLKILNLDVFEDAPTDVHQQIKLLRARVNFNLGKTEGVEAPLKELIEQDPLNGEALILMGEYAMSKSEYEDAEYYFERATHIQGHEAVAFESLGRLFIEKRDYKQAIPYFEKAIKINNAEYLIQYLNRIKQLL